jgi:hypothetical protein
LCGGAIHVDSFFTLNPVKVFAPDLTECCKRCAVMFAAHGTVTVTDVGYRVIDRVANFTTQTPTMVHVAPPRLDV